MYYRATIAALLTAAFGCDSSSEDECSRCRITITEIVTLRTPPDSTALISGGRTVVDSEGRFFVAPVADPGVIAVFTADGRFLHTIGRFGSGPQEFRRITRLAVAGDSLLVFDAGHARMSVLSPSLEVRRTVRVPHVIYDVVRRGDGQFVMAALVETRTASTSPYHVVDDTGIVRSFGAAGDPGQRPDLLTLVRSLAPAGSGGFWAGHINRYQIDRMDSTGAVEPVVQRSVPWFPPWTKSEGAPPWLIRPNTKLTAIREDAGGNLWTFLLVAHPDWKPVVPQPKPIRDGPFPVPDADAIDRILERVIEVIDPRTGRVLATRRVPGSFTELVGNDMIARHREAADGTIEIVISRLALADSSRR